MHNQTLAQLSTALTEKKISSVELTEHYLARIKRYDPQLNAMITLTESIALTQARHADSLRQQGNASPLTGIPIVQKDIFCTTGVKTSCGSHMLDNFIAPYNATMVEQCNQHGMVLLGKSNMDEFAMGSSNENSYYGPVRNPWNTECVAGGSSGGAAALVAARLCPASTGSDTGGSIRQPAALCGLTALKPTYGLISRYGMIAYASSLDQAGPFAQTAEDVALLMNVMVSHDLKDATSLPSPTKDFTAELHRSIKGLKIGLPKEYFQTGLEPSVGTLIQTALKTLENAGAILVDISLPNSHLAIPAYYIIAPAECSSNLARYDGVRYGYRCENPKDLNDLYCRSRSEAFGEEVKRRILIGTYVLSSGYYDAYYVKAQKVRRKIANEFTEAFQTVDIIASPTAPNVAFRLGEKTNDPLSMYLSDIYTIAVNLAGLPGLSMPAGFHNDLPVGLQLIGPHFSDSLLLNTAHQYQQVTDWHTRIPSAFTD
jgi:aspartyl-tRNA(Asn)/glutamyl-tRNA(Gln) amidotransferase subunit A